MQRIPSVLMGESGCHPRILVVGDLMLDKYTFGTVERVSPEAPVLILKTSASEVRAGGAANVAVMCAALGAKVSVVGVVGEDHDGRTLQKLLSEQAVCTDLVLTIDTRMTTAKQRFLGGAEHRQSQQLLRVDCEVSGPISIFSERTLLEKIKEAMPDIDIVIVSDYSKGVCTPALVQGIAELARQRGIRMLVDPARDANYEIYEGAFLVKANRNEASIASGHKIRSLPDAESAARHICGQHSFPAILITLDKDGMLLYEEGEVTSHYAATRREVCDITGAGDMAMAVLGFGLAQKWPVQDCVHMANVAAGLEVEKIGTVTLTWEQILAADTKTRFSEKIVTLGQLERVVEAYRSEGKRVVFTNGCFDLLHLGHITYLSEAAALGDILIVGLNSDASVRRLKGESRPIVEQASRAAMLASLADVNHVIIFDQDTPCLLLDRLRPDVLAKGGTYLEHEVVGREIVEAYGGEVQVLSEVGNYSTSQIIASIAGRFSSDVSVGKMESLQPDAPERI